MLACSRRGREAVATVRLQVTAQNGPGVQASWLRIDRHDVVIENGRGFVDVEADDFEQTYSYWFVGNSRSTFSFEVLQSDTSLKKVKDSIAVGYNRAVGAGHFKLLSPMGLW